jgi:hypothetical protein
MGRRQKAGWSGFVKYAHPKEAETERGRTTRDHRGHEAALGGIPEGEVAVVGQILPPPIPGTSAPRYRQISETVSQTLQQLLHGSCDHAGFIEVYPKVST